MVFILFVEGNKDEKSKFCRIFKFAVHDQQAYFEIGNKATFNRFTLVDVKIWQSEVGRN